MLRKSRDFEKIYTGVRTPQVPALVPFGDAVGCLGVHVKTCGNFSPMVNLSYFKNMMVRISVSNLVKCTKPCNLPPTSDEKNGIINFDELKYFSIKIPRRQGDKRNIITFELIKQTEKYTYFLGSAQVHLYKVIQEAPFTEEFPIIRENTTICRLEIRLMFAYGNFGFGFSHQLKSLQRDTAQSMFINIPPPPDRRDPIMNVMTTLPIDHPAFLSSNLNVSVGKPSQMSLNNQSLVQFETLKQPAGERLEQMKKEYGNLSSWRERANYLEALFNSDVGNKPRKSIHISKEYESPTEKKSEDLTTLDVPIVEDKDEITPTQEQYFEKETLPSTFNQSSEDDVKFTVPESDESKKQQSSPKFDIPRLIVTEDSDIAPLADNLMEDYLSSEKDKYSSSQESKDAYLSGTESYSSKNLISSSTAAYDSLNYPIFEDSSKTCGSKNTNRKGKQAEFSSSSEEDSLYLNKINSTYSIQESNTQDDFALLLRNINSKVSERRNKCRNSSSYSDVVEYEDQDPSYSTKSEPEQLKKAWAQAPDVILVEALEPDSVRDSAVPAAETSSMDKQLAHELVNDTIETLEDKGALEGRLPNSQGESPAMEDEIAGCPPQSKSSCLKSHIENLKQSMVLKSMLSKDLQDLSEKLFSELDISMGTASKKSSSIILTVQDDKSPSGLKDQIFEESQYLDSLISKGRPENISCVAMEQVPEQNSLAEEVDFPVHKKTHFKTKHLESEMCDSKPDLNDCASYLDIKKIVIAPFFSKMGEEANETQKQLPTDRECLSSKILLHNEESKDKMELPQAKSIISQIIQAFPVDILLECGMIKVVELNNEYHSKFLLDSGADFAEEHVKYSTNDDSESFPGQSIPIIPKETTSTRRVQFIIGKSQNMSPQYSEYQSTPDNKTNLSSNSESFYSKENYIRYLKGLNNSITSKHSESDIIMSFLKSIFNVYFKYSQSRRRQQPEKDLERLINHSFLNNTEDFREMEENFDKVDKLDQKPILSQKLCVFLEELSEAEMKNLKSELSKHIQHYLVEGLLDAGHITKEDLPKIYQNLHLMNEKKEPIGQNNNHHCIGKQLEIKLRSLLNEILQNYFLRNFSESSLFKQIESENLHSNLSSLRAKKPSISSHDLRQGTTRGGFYRKPEIKMKYPLSKSLQDYLKALSDNELLNIQTNLSKRIYCLWIERLSKLGLITETQIKRATPHIKLIHSNATQLKSIKSDLCCQDKNGSMKGHLENQDSIPEIVQNTTIPENRELIRTEKKESTRSNNVKENSSVIGEQETHPVEEAETQGLESESSNKNSLVIALNTDSSERLTDSELKKQDATQFSRADTVGLKTEIQDPFNGRGKAKPVQPNVCCERMLRTKPLDKQEHNSFCRLLIQRNTEAVPVTCPRLAACKMASEDKDNGSKCPFNFNLRRNNTSYFDPESGDKFECYNQYQRWKGHNNNNKQRPLVIFEQHKKETQTLYPKLLESSNDKYATFLESHPVKCKTMKAEKGSKSFLFPEVFKSKRLKPKIQKEGDHYGKQKESLPKIGRGLPNLMPATRGLRKSIPKSMRQWTARTTIHDCSDKFEELPENAIQNSEKAKSRARLVGKSPEEHLKHPGKPYTIPEMIKRRDSYSGRRTRSRLSSTSSFQMRDLAQDYEAPKMQQGKFLREC